MFFLFPTSPYFFLLLIFYHLYSSFSFGQSCDKVIVACTIHLKNYAEKILNKQTHYVMNGVAPSTDLRCISFPTTDPHN
jgi:hypothetical protein